MNFRIEQVALHPRDPERALALLRDMGLVRWVDDHVTATGHVVGAPAQSQNEADLHFNYGPTGALELEVLNYTDGPHWMAAHPPRVSHLGMHTTEADLERWRAFFEARGIDVAQEVWTTEHTNPHIAGERWYHYCIFNTYPILGVDVKFIVRKAEPPEGLRE